MNPVDIVVFLRSWVVVSSRPLDDLASLFSDPYDSISIAEQLTSLDGINAQWVSFVAYATHELSDVHLLSQSDRSVKQL